MAQHANDSNFQTPFISQGAYQINFDKLESLIRNPSARRKGKVKSRLEFEKSPESVTVFTSHYRGSHKKQITIIIDPRKLTVVRNNTSDVYSPTHLSADEFQVLEYLEEIGILKQLYDYYTGDLYQVVRENPQDFVWGKESYRLSQTIGAAPEVGRVFIPSELEDFRSAIQPDKNPELKDEVLGFCIPDLRNYKGFQLLKAFLGKTAANPDNLRTFSTFKIEEINQQLPQLSDNQLKLLKISERIEELSEFEQVGKEYATLQPHEDARMLEASSWALWEKAIELLKKERYVYCYRAYNKRELRTKPRRTYMYPIEIAQTPFQPAFQFIEGEDRMQLKTFMLHRGKRHQIGNTFPKGSPIFYQPDINEPLAYAAASFRDIRLWNWLDPIKNFTIHKTFAREFLEEVLPNLCTHYPVQFRFKSKTDLEINKTTLRPEKKWIHISQEGNRILFTPYLKYHEREQPVNVLSNGTQWLLHEGQNRTVQVRSKKEENAIRKILLGLHHNFPSQARREQLELRVADFWENNWFLEAFSKLKDSGIDLVGVESLENFEYLPYGPDIKFEVTSEKGWFDIGLEVKFGNQVIQLDQLRKAVIKDKGIVKTKNGKKGIIPSAWQDKLRGMLSVGQGKNQKLVLSKAHYPMLDKLYGKNAPKDFKQWISMKRKRLENPVATKKINLPHVNADLRSYQKAGFEWMKALQEEEWGGILADDMGLGKTLQVLTLLLDRKESTEKKTSLLVAPKTLLYNWEEQAARFTPDLKIYRYYGTNRKKLQKKIHQCDLIITTYDTVKWDIDFFGKTDFEYMICDEAQAIKNSDTERYQALNLINSRFRLALTGTPVENSIMDLYALMNFVNPGFFGTERNFRNIFLQRGPGDKSRRMEALQTAINPFILRRTKEKVAKDLPEKTEMILYCEMESQQRKLYDKLRKYYKGELEEQTAIDGAKGSKLKVLEGLMRLRQICDHPQLIPGQEDYKGGAAKMDALLQQVLEKVEYHKILIFSQFTGMLKLIREAINDAGIQYSYLDGQTSEAARRTAVQNFQEDDQTRVFLLSLKAGGSGLNLTAGDYVFLVDPWWNPAVESQAIDRCYRIGQDKHVMAYRMICKDTVEEKIISMQVEKQQLASDLIPTDESILKSLDTKALLKLFD